MYFVDDIQDEHAKMFWDVYLFDKFKEVQDLDEVVKAL